MVGEENKIIGFVLTKKHQNTFNYIDNFLNFFVVLFVYFFRVESYVFAIE